MGDLAVGDKVFAATGEVTTVVYKSEIFRRKCYELEFSDGTTIVCSEEHPWAVHDFASRRLLEKRTVEFRAKRKAKRKPGGTGKRPDLAARNAAAQRVLLPPPEARTVSTAEIAASVDVKLGQGTAKNWSIENQGPLELPTAILPIPPYTLGAWLGDGSSATGHIHLPETAGGGKAEVVDGILSDGFACHRLPSNADTVSVVGLGAMVRALDGKHIPPAYLRASRDQRLAMLQGLMDTDGWAEKDGSCRISLSNRTLFLGVVELLRTLGINPHVTDKIPHYTYKGARREGQRAYLASFMSTFPVFRLPRKLALQKTTVQSRYKRRFIVAAREVPTVETQCIGISHPSHLFLVGDQFVPTHNTDFLVMACVAQIALCHDNFLRTGRKQRGRYIIFRKNSKNLADIIQRAEEMYPVIDPGAKFNIVAQRWTFSSGYKVDFAHLDGPEDHKGYNGQEITGIGIDQVEEIAEEVYRFLAMQIRSKFADMRALLFMRVTANPGGRHAAWVKRYFVEGCKPHNTIIKTTVTLRGGKKRDVTKAFVPATLYDNKYLAEDGAYEANLLSLPEHLRRMYLEGDWDVVIGAYFSHVWNRSIHVIPSFPISGSWPIKFSLDWGTSAPAATLWGARDNDGNVYIIDELYRPGITGRTYGEAMLKKLDLQKWSNERKWTVRDMYGLIDREAMAARGVDAGGGSATPAAGIQWCGWRIFPAIKDRAAGNEQVLERLLVKPNGKPSLFIFGDRCPNLVRELPMLMSDPHNPEDVDSSGSDHAFDALKYLLMDWPVQGTRPKDKGKDQDVERWLAMAARRKELENAPGDTITTGYGD